VALLLFFLIVADRVMGEDMFYYAIHLEAQSAASGDKISPKIIQIGTISFYL